MVHMLNKDNYEQEVMKAEGTDLVDFYADWCRCVVIKINSHFTPPMLMIVNPLSF